MNNPTTMPADSANWQVRIEPVAKEHRKLALGCWTFGGDGWGGQDDNDSLGAMEAALNCGMNHFDTARGYGREGRSEKLVGQFLASDRRREEVFLATKGRSHDGTGEGILAHLQDSLERLQVDSVDLYYVHWPSPDKDMRPMFQALEDARSQGKTGAIGVSNFSVEQMRQAAKVAHIDAHQLCYNLLWRRAEDELIPYCRENRIAIITYSSIAQGILSGKFPRNPEFAEGDGRARMVLFEKDVWPKVYEGVEQLKVLADEVNVPLVHLAIRWVANRPWVRSILVGARNASQVEQNAAAATGEIGQDTFDRMTAISDEVIKHLPDAGNIFRYYP